MASRRPFQRVAFLLFILWEGRTPQRDRVLLRDEVQTRLERRELPVMLTAQLLERHPPSGAVSAEFQDIQSFGDRHEQTLIQAVSKGCQGF